MNTSSTPTSERNIIPRQRWLRIIPPILIACIISYMDRVNIAFAMPGGMDAELGISATMAGLAGGIFFIGYLFLQVPGGKIAVHGSGKKFIGWSLVAWAVISVLTGLITNQYQLLVLRFLLGVAEGGMLPVVLTMISNWFPDAERGRANAIVIMFVPIAGIVTAPLSGWIITVLDWRWLFIIEGLLSIVVLVLWALTVYDRPQEARWISDAEKNYLVDTLAAEQRAIAGKEVRNASLSAVLADKTMWQLIALNFFYQTGIYGYTLWLPTILKELTHSTMGQGNARHPAVCRGDCRDVPVFCPVGQNRQTQAVRFPAADRLFAVHVPVSRAERPRLAVIHGAGRLRLLPAIRRGGVLDHSGPPVQRRNGRRRARSYQCAGKSWRLLRPVCRRRADHPLQQRRGRLLPGRLAGAGGTDGAVAARHMRCGSRPVETESQPA